MEREVLAKAEFSATSGQEKYTATLELVPSGCFPYGNKHALIFKRYMDGLEIGGTCFDVRYDQRFNTAETFNKYALDVVKAQFRDDFTIERIG